MKKFAFLALAVGAAFSNTASARPIFCSSGFQPLSYFASIGSYNAQSDSGGCMSQDKIWGGFSFTNAGANSQGRISTETINGVDIYKLQIVFDPIPSIASPGSYAYTITNDPLGTNHFFDQIILGVDINTVAVNAVYQGIDSNGHVYNITNPGGAGGSFSRNTSGNDDSYISVAQYWTASGQGQLNSLTHTYIQSTIPEPDSLVLFGIGFVGFAVSRRRSSKA